MINLEYLTNSVGETTAVVIPIEIWQQLLPNRDSYRDPSLEVLGDAIEDYCLNKAIDEGKNSPLYDRAEALAFLGI
jgi:hypothetical protein